MAKKPKQPNFYEQLSGFYQRELTPFEPIQSAELAQKAKQILQAAASIAGAALEDVGYLTYRGLRWLGAANTKRSRKVLISAMAVGAAGVTVVASTLAIGTLGTYAKDLANPSALMNRNRVGTTILDRNGKVLYRAEGADNRIDVKFKNVPEDLINATLAAEDDDFFNHSGVSIKGTARALWNDINHREKLEGGSTISQQLIKNTLLTPKKSFKRKYQEVVLAIMLERQYTKNEILELYFNEVFYGQGARGAGRAAQTYFHKDLEDLSLSQTALLAGLPLGPSRFDPNFDPEAARDRRDYVLGRMEELGYITAAEESAAKKEPIRAYAQRIELNAPHFVFYVLEQLREEYGEELVASGGITVYTTLDLKKQRIAEEEVRNQVNKIAWQHVTNGGLVSLDPRTGEILAMVGSTDFNNTQFGKVNVTLSRLQPGSSFKPFAYATAFKKGYSGATLVQDKPMRVADGSGKEYVPVNYDGKFRGPVLLRRALANSLNIPAVKVIEHAGVQDTLETARDMGLTFIGNDNRFGLSLALGSAEIKPLELAEAYATFAQMGHKVSSKTIMKVEDRYSADITQEEETDQPEVLDPRIAYMIVHILSDNKAREEIFGANSVLELPRPAFVKTGTTDDWRDNFTAGSTPDLTTVVWVGNNDHTPMNNVTGVTGAAPIWRNYMLRALANSPELEFKRPAGLITATVCTRDGGLANPWDQKVAELFLSENKPTKRCSTKLPAPKKEQGKKEEDEAKTKPSGSGGSADPLPEPDPEPEPEPDGDSGRGFRGPGGLLD